MKEPELFGDLPHAPSPVSERDRLGDQPDNHHAIFGLAAELNELVPEATQSEENATTLASASIALHSVSWRMGDFRR